MDNLTELTKMHDALLAAAESADEEAKRARAHATSLEHKSLMCNAAVYRFEADCELDGVTFPNGMYIEEANITMTPA